MACETNNYGGLRHFHLLAYLAHNIFIVELHVIILNENVLV